MAFMSRTDSNSQFPMILPPLLEDIEWPPRDMDKPVTRILSRENVCNDYRLHHVNIDEWKGQIVDDFVSKLSRLVGVELLVLYDSNHFTPAASKDIQDTIYGWSCSHIECRVSGITAGWNSFRDLRSVLGPLFDSDQDIESIEQERGQVAGKEVAMVTSQNDDDMTDRWNNSFCDEDGEEYSVELVSKTRRQTIHARNDQRLLICKDRTTVLRIGHIEPRGMELCVVYYPGHFSVTTTRPEVQSHGECPDSHFQYLNCVILDLHEGPATFHDVKEALQPLFHDGDVRGIEQRQGSMAGATVVEVQHPDDTDATRYAGHDSTDGRQYSIEDVEEKRKLVITASGDDEMERQLKKMEILKIDAVEEGGEVLIVGGQRTVLRLHGLCSGAELFVASKPRLFTPVSCPEVQTWRLCPRGRECFAIKCQVPGIHPGSIPFEEVRAALQRLYTGPQIRSILQCRGFVAGREVAEVTSYDDDEMNLWYNGMPYCDIDGAQHTWAEAGKPAWTSINEGDCVFICGGGRRTILIIKT